MSQLQSSNPVFADQLFDQKIHAQPAGGVATVQGVINKTGACAMLCAIAGAIAYAVTASNPGWSMGFMIASLIFSFVAFFAIWRSPSHARWVAPIYSLLQGATIGSVTFFLEKILESKGITVAGGLALQAFVITMALMGTMLGLYKARILRGGQTFQMALTVATVGLMVVMLIGFVLSLFGVSLPFISIGSALEGGTPALIGLGINVLVLGLASLWLVVDFRVIDDAVQSGAPREAEWYLAFGLVVTLVWVYIEALKLAFRLAAMFGGKRD
ncbi:MAG: hypothetical protein RL527_495 [Planctomycetota bacterium]|jgi:uncharacterized YccA/Bax inhibitor family protein